MVRLSKRPLTPGYEKKPAPALWTSVLSRSRFLIDGAERALQIVDAVLTAAWPVDVAIWFHVDANEGTAAMLPAIAAKIVPEAGPPSVQVSKEHRRAGAPRCCRIAVTLTGTPPIAVPTMFSSGASARRQQLATGQERTSAGEDRAPTAGHRAAAVADLGDLGIGRKLRRREVERGPDAVEELAALEMPVGVDGPRTLIVADGDGPARDEEAEDKRLLLRHRAVRRRARLQRVRRAAVPLGRVVGDGVVDELILAGARRDEEGDYGRLRIADGPGGPVEHLVRGDVQGRAERDGLSQRGDHLTRGAVDDQRRTKWPVRLSTHSTAPFAASCQRLGGM